MSFRTFATALALLATACSGSGAQGSPIDGTWTVSMYILLPGTPPGEDPTIRTFVFSSDCTGDTCRTTGHIESADGTEQVEVTFDGENYVFGFARTATWAPDGETLCKWESTMKYRMRPSQIDDDQRAITMEGELVETPSVVAQADGVDCSAPPFVSVMTAVRATP